MPNNTLPADAVRFVAHLCDSRRIAASSARSYWGSLRRLAAWAAAGNLADYLRPTGDELQAFRDALAARLAPASLRLTLTTVRRFYRFLAAEGKVVPGAVEIAAALAPPCRGEGPMPLLTAQEAARLLAAPVPGERLYLRDRALLAFFLATGARVPEVCRLELDDLSTDRACVRLRRQAGPDRVVFLGEHAAAALRAYLDGLRPVLTFFGPAAPWVFLSQRARALTPGFVSALVVAYARRAGLQAGLGVGALRHVAAAPPVVGADPAAPSCLPHRGTPPDHDHAIRA